MSGKYGLGFDHIYADEVNTKITAAQERLQLLFLTHGFAYKVGNIPIPGICPFQSLSRNVFLSLPIVVTVRIGCLYT